MLSELPTTQHGEFHHRADSHRNHSCKSGELADCGAVHCDIYALLKLSREWTGEEQMVRSFQGSWAKRAASAFRFDDALPEQDVPRVDTPLNQQTSVELHARGGSRPPDHVGVAYLHSTNP